MNDRSVIFQAALDFAGDDGYRGVMRCVHSDPFGAPPTFDCAQIELVALVHAVDGTLSEPIGGELPWSNIFTLRSSRGTTTTPGKLVFFSRIWSETVVRYGMFTPDQFIVEEGDVINGLTIVNFRNNKRAAVSDSGLIAFVAEFDDGGGTNEFGLFASAGGNVIPVALPGDATDEGRTFVAIAAENYAPDIDVNDCITFVGKVNDGGSEKTGAFKACINTGLPADSDGDGVPDADDACPSQDATGADEDGDGCIDPAPATQNLIDDLTELQEQDPDNPTLSNGQFNSLIGELEDAEALILKGNYNAALDKLNTFIRKVKRLNRRGELTDEEAQSLIDAANTIIGQVSP